jgi:hypothetical protein
MGQGRPAVLRRFPSEPAIAAEHLLLERLQMGTRVEPELVGEHLTDSPQHVQGFALPIAAVERECPLGVEALVKGGRGCQGLRLHDGLAMPAQLDQRVETGLLQLEVPLPDAVDVTARPLVRARLRIRLTPPEARRLLRGGEPPLRTGG